MSKGVKANMKSIKEQENKRYQKKAAIKKFTPKLKPLRIDKRNI